MATTTATASEEKPILSIQTIIIITILNNDQSEHIETSIIINNIKTTFFNKIEIRGMTSETSERTDDPGVEKRKNIFI